MNPVMVVSNVLRILSALFLIGYSHPLSGFPLRYSNGNTYRYSYVTVTSFSEPGATSSSAATHVGFSIQTSVHITPIWSSGSTVVVKLSIVEPEMRSVSRPAQYRALQALPRLPVYFQWTDGRVDKVFMSSADPTLAVNIKKGIISLFQLRVEDSEQHAEVDSSGVCDVSYRTSSGGATIIKTKTNCKNLDLAGRFTQVNDLLGVDVTSQSSVEYSVRSEILEKAQALETWHARVNLLPGLSALVTAQQNLSYIDTIKSESIQAADVTSLIKQLNKGSSDEIYGTGLGSMFESRQCSVSECRSAGDAVREYRDSLRAEAGGKESTSSVFVELVRALRRSSTEDIYNILVDNNNKHIVMSLIDASTAAQTSSSQEALMKYLSFTDERRVDAIERFLLAAALSTHPSHSLVRYLLGVFRQRVPDVRLRESVSEALGAVLRTFQQTASEPADRKLISEVEEALLKELEGCGGDTTCSLILIRSLSNAALSQTLPTLLSLVQRSNESRVSEAAARALHRFNASLITAETKKQLSEIFHERRRRYDTTIRSQILTLLLRLEDLSAQDLTDILHASTDLLNTEFNTYIQAKLFNAAQHNQRIRLMLSDSLKNSKLSNYVTLSPRGTSLAFTSLLTDAPVTTYHMYLENGRSGLMKRSGMDISVRGAAGQQLPVYNFGIQAAGLEGAVGEGEVQDSEKDVEMTAGMSLDMIGVSLRPITFFTGQAGLMSAVWNAPSELVSALQTNFLLQDHSERIHLHNGLVAELNVLGAVSLDLSGSLSVSLWNKNAQSLIKNSGAITIGGSFQVMTTSFQAGAEFKASGGSCIDFRTDVDFYEGVKLCLQMSRPAFQLKLNSTRFESAKGFSKSYRQTTWRKSLINGLSYPLPASNSLQCKIMSQNNS